MNDWHDWHERHDWNDRISRELHGSNAFLRGLTHSAHVACWITSALLVAACTSPKPAELYATPDAAVDSFVAALRTDDKAELARILGSDSDELISSGDPVADAQAREEFVRHYDQKHLLVPEDDGDRVTLEIGDADWPFPVPVVRDADGWRFDTAAGLDELINRRIGRNELATIESCRAVSDAQAEYFAKNPSNSPTREFARKFISSPGTQDGLYWPTLEGEPASPLGELVANATEEGYVASGAGAPFHGYFYRMLTAQGDYAPGGRMSYLAGDRLTNGFGVLAWPADYGNSGVMAFIMNQQGIVYQRDLGEETDRAARAMTEFNPDPEWMLAD